MIHYPDLKPNWNKNFPALKGLRRKVGATLLRCASPHCITYICDLKYDSVAILWMTQSNPWHAYDFKDKVNFMDYYSVYHSSLSTLGYFQIFLFVLYIYIGFKADYRDLWILFFKGWNLVLFPPFLHSLIWFYHCPVYNYYYLYCSEKFVNHMWPSVTLCECEVERWTRSVIELLSRPEVNVYNIPTNTK